MPASAGVASSADPVTESTPVSQVATAVLAVAGLAVQLVAPVVDGAGIPQADTKSVVVLDQVAVANLGKVIPVSVAGCLP